MPRGTFARRCVPLPSPLPNPRNCGCPGRGAGARPVSLVGFKASNHPQQTGRRGARLSVDDRGTDPAVFAALDAKYRFTLDAAASAENAKCAVYYTVEDNGLVAPWTGARVWCNPPYSNLYAWVDKAWKERAAELIVMLVPANRTEQPWWQDCVEPLRDRAGSRLTTQFLPGRMRFTAPGQHTAPPNSRPPFGCCLLIWSPLPSLVLQGPTTASPEGDA